MVTSNLPFGRWGETFSDDIVAAAMIDRLVHHAEVLTLTGDSYRTRQRRQLLAKDNRSDRGYPTAGVNFHGAAGGAGSTGQRNDLCGSARISLIYEGDVDDRPSDDGATPVGPTAQRERPIAARDRPSGWLLPRGRPRRRAPRIQAARAIRRVAAGTGTAELGRSGGDQSRAARR